MTDAAILEFSVRRVVPVRVYEQVVDQIREWISEGKLKPGDKLPVERELAEVFNVSRNSVRAALRTLETIGLIESRQGAGTFVREGMLDHFQDTLSRALASKREAIEEILTARKIFEPGIAYYAALNATTSDIAELEEIIRQHEERAVQNDPGVEEDSRFHYTIARISGNTVVLEVMDVIMDLIAESRELLLRYPDSDVRSSHREIVAALKAKDPAAASQAMLNHIEEVEAAYHETFSAVSDGK